MDSVFDSVTDREYRSVTYSRGGCGASTPIPGRTVAGRAEECRLLVDHVGVQRYLVAGRSTGGPYALAAAVAGSPRVSGVLLLVSFAPHDADELDFASGMGVQNQVLSGTASRGEQEQRAVVTQMAALVRDSAPADLAAGIASPLPSSRRGSSSRGRMRATPAGPP